MRGLSTFFIGLLLVMPACATYCERGAHPGWPHTDACYVKPGAYDNYGGHSGLVPDLYLDPRCGGGGVSPKGCGDCD
jgi:hypothetical protein